MLSQSIQVPVEVLGEEKKKTGADITKLNHKTPSSLLVFHRVKQFLQPNNKHTLAWGTKDGFAHLHSLLVGFRRFLQDPLHLLQETHKGRLLPALAAPSAAAPEGWQGGF